MDTTITLIFNYTVIAVALVAALLWIVVITSRFQAKRERTWAIIITVMLILLAVIGLAGGIHPILIIGAMVTGVVACLIIYVVLWWYIRTH